MSKNQTAAPSGGEHKLTKNLTVLDGWTIGTGAMVGVTIFVVSGQISALAGPSACLGFLFAGIIVLFVALCYCEVSSAFPVAGGAYVFPQKTIGGVGGDFLSFVSGWALWGGQGICPVIVSMSCADYIIWMIQLLGYECPLPPLAITVILILIFTLSNIWSTGGGRAIHRGGDDPLRDLGRGKCQSRASHPLCPRRHGGHLYRLRPVHHRLQRLVHHSRHGGGI